MKKLILFGTGYGFKNLVEEISLVKKYKIIGAIDEYLPKNKIIHKKKNIKILGKINDLKKMRLNNIYFLIGIGHNFIRKKIVDEIKKKKIKVKWISFLSKSAIIAKNVKIGDGTIVMPGSVINSGSKIGSHCYINTKSSIDHDNFLKNYSSTGPGVVTGGNVKVDECSHIGIGSTVLQKVHIKSNTVIGGHSLINKNCLPNSIYFGVPAKYVRKRKEIEKYL